MSPVARDRRRWGLATAWVIHWPTMISRLRERGAQSAAFASLQNNDFRKLWWAGLYTFISVQMQFVLRGLLAWDLTEREGALGLVYLCFGLTLLVATPLGGVATDRFDKRTMLVVSQVGIVLSSVLIGIAVLLDIATFWMVLASSVVQGMSFGLFGPARIAFSSHLVGREQLGNAIALSLLSMNGTRVFAPSLAGALAGWALFGIGGAYLVASVFSVISVYYLFLMPRFPATDSGAATRSPLADIADGVRHVNARPPLRRLVLASFFIIMFGFNYVSFYPAVVEGLYGLGDAWVGIISTGSAIGAVSVSIPLASRADSPRAKTAMIIGSFGFGLGVIAFGLAPGFWAAFCVVAVVGAMTTVYQTLSNTLALQLADDSHQGRVQSLMQLSFAGFGIAAAPLGLLAEVISLPVTLVLMGVATVITAAVYYLGERRDPTSGLAPASGRSEAAPAA